ncbi:2Fe-2S iron-sulfur cluster-binding protein [Epilithonimonas hungarica]|uniref:NADH-quinone oxidoreductase subunit G n=1 Tax=Epilithonimonas hungarica TaxID=454006 RepID=A0A1G7I4V2_9FLAO|nr:2Fe-2S iron-sulfur cluster-binding protein [Epilithonimonas hungarica]MDP9957951.1 NADH-quinone oxidoreductase subunit G [Epilithonimonas hungarica]MPT33296.1 2Fe-2S iron-sulfur cluster binding domain-containing protein [Chryseobacterium sp.]SDF07516.1 NADH-quinone oxidoreductase subunit G [Epilithonimonas hungarica]
MSEEVKKFKVTIDGQTTEVLPGTSILEAARQIGGKSVPPAMCYYSKLETSGGRCRTCLVEVSKGSEADPRPMPKLVASCRTGVMDGMEVKNLTSEKAQEGRKAVTEFLLVNHPLDCPICDQAGECHLQDLGYEHGVANTRTEFERNTYDADDIGPNIKLNMNRCILCARCVLAANQLTEKREHGILYRGDHAEISTMLNKALDNDFIGNVIDVCPVGALTDRTARFESRVWFTKPYNATCSCTKCSGKAVLWMKGDTVVRVTARKDQYGEVEDWICDECRFHKKDTALWNIEGPRHIDRHSVISLNHYEKKTDSYNILDNPEAKEIGVADEKEIEKLDS